MRKSVEYYLIAIVFVFAIAFGIIYFIFNAAEPEFFLQPAPISYFNLSYCGNLDVNNSVYVLNTSLSGINSANNENNCLRIVGNDIVVDGLGSYALSGNSAIGSIGVLVEGNNAIIKNLNISGYETGISVKFSNGSTIFKNFIYNNSFANVNISHSNFTNITSNFLSLSPIGIGLEGSRNNLLIENGIYNTAPGMVFGIIAIGGDRNSFIKNIISKTSYGIYLHTALSSILLNNIVGDSSLNGIFIFNSNAPNFIRGGEILVSQKSAIMAQDSIELVLDGVNITDTVFPYYDLEINGSSKISLIESSLERYSFPPAGIIAKFRDYGNGEITFLSPINGSGNNLSDDVKIKFNFAEVKSNSNIGLNRGANISFEGLSMGFVNPQIKRNGFDCPASICTVLTGLNAGNVIFNVTGWTNYSIAGTGIVQSLTIEEPDDDDIYRTNQFPLQFRVDLNMNGTLSFNITQGNSSVFNANMNTTNNQIFTYNVPSLGVGNYSFAARAVFINGTVLTDASNFRVLLSSTTNSTSGTNTGSNSNNPASSINQSNNTASNNPNTFSASNGSSNSNNDSGSNAGTNSSGAAMKNIAYWLVIIVLILAIAVLIVLILNYFRKKDAGQAPQIVGSVVSGLR